MEFRTQFLLAKSVALWILAGTAVAQAADTESVAVVEVAVYEFPPYYSSFSEQHLIGRLVDTLNQRQGEYQIQIREVRPSDRYQALAEEGCCDIMLFESPDWGWEDSTPEEVITGSALTQGSDLYVSMHERPLELMAQQPTVGGMRGYHYNFTNYERNFDILEFEHNLYLADNPLMLLNMLTRGRLDVVMISAEYLQYLGQTNANLFNETAIHTAVDQSYTTYVLAPARNKGLLQWFEAQLEQLSEEGALQDIFAEFGLTERLRYAPER